MGIMDSFANSIKGSLADQWIDVVSTRAFKDLDVVLPGVYVETNKNRGSNVNHSDGVITNGSLIRVPENTAAVIFRQSGIEDIITEPGEFEYRHGEDSVFDERPEGKSLMSHMMGTLKDQAVERMKFGGIPPTETRIIFVNTREIRNVRFGTRGPQAYNDLYYKCDLEIYAYGTFTLQVTDPALFVRNFLPANAMSYSFASDSARGQIIGEFLQSFMIALNSLSAEYRISQLPSQAGKIAQSVQADQMNVGSWPERFGIRLVKIGIENIEFSDDARELVKKFNERRMDVSAYEETSQRASNMAAQQKIATGIQENGLGEGGGMLFGMNLTNGMTPDARIGATSGGTAMDLDQQIETLKKLKELVDMGVLTQDEFEAKKREIMGL